MYTRHHCKNSRGIVTVRELQGSVLAQCAYSLSTGISMVVISMNFLQTLLYDSLTEANIHLPFTSQDTNKHCCIRTCMPLAA